MSHRGRIIFRELKAHLPYSVGSVLFALALLAGFTLLVGRTDPEAFESVSDTTYHVTHPLHMLLSAAATAAMFWGYQRRIAKTVVVSIAGSIVPCSLSDFAIPFLGGRIYDATLTPHLCVVEHPWLVAPFAILGTALGIVARRTVEGSTFLSHSGHVVVSSLASALYLSTFGGLGWIDFLPLVSVTVFVAVLIPCCLSDIVVPLLFVQGGHLETCLCHHHGRGSPHRSLEPVADDGAEPHTHR